MTYSYNGAEQVVGKAHSDPDIEWLMYDGSGGYPDLDRFDRVVQSRWTKDLGSDVDFYDVDITYDRNSNVVRREDNVHPGFDVSYTVDDLDRLTRAQEGTWSGSSITSETRDQEWTLNHPGNWDNTKLDLDGDGSHTGTDEQDDARTYNEVNELTARDVDSDSIDDYTLRYDDVGNLTDDGESYKFEYDAFGRLRKVRDQSDNLVAEYKYSGLDFLLSEHVDTDDDGDVDGDDKWFHNAYDERWRKLATFREDDTDPKEEYVSHQAGLGGRGYSSYHNGIVLRFKDANRTWTQSSDGVLEQTIYYCQNARGDVSGLVGSAGYMIGWTNYSSYGIPFGLPGGDTDSDGDCDATDISQVQSWIDGSTYDLRGDLDLDGDVDSTDKSTAQALYEGLALGWGVLSDDEMRNTLGYGGDLQLPWGITALARRRFLFQSIGHWNRRDPAGYHDGPNTYTYVEGRVPTLRDPSGLTACATTFSESQTPYNIVLADGSQVPYHIDDGLLGFFSKLTSSGACEARLGRRFDVDPVVNPQSEGCPEFCYWHGKNQEIENQVVCCEPECGYKGKLLGINWDVKEGKTFPPGIPPVIAFHKTGNAGDCVSYNSCKYTNIVFGGGKQSQLGWFMQAVIDCSAHPVGFFSLGVRAIGPKVQQTALAPPWAYGNNPAPLEHVVGVRCLGVAPYVSPTVFKSE